MSMKNPITPAGIEPATFRFVAQQLQKVGLLNFRIDQEFGIPRGGPNQTTLNARVIELF